MENSDARKLFQKVASQKDKTAFSQFFRMYHSRLIRYALLYVYSYKDAEDVVSEVIIKLLRKNNRIKEIKNFEGYLYSAIKNQALNLIKKNNRKSQCLLSDIPQDYLTNTYIQPIHIVLENELRSLITQTVENLPPQRRIVYKMIKDDNLRIREVAGLLDIAEKTVKKHLELAMKDLRKTIELYYSEKDARTRVIDIQSNISVISMIFACILFI